MKIRVLLVTYFPLRDDLSTGNTLLNVFRGLEDNFEFYNVYIKEGIPNNCIVNSYYNISEKELLKSVLKRNLVGSKVFFENINNTHLDNGIYYNKARQLRWDSLLLAQDLIGLIGCINYKELDSYVSEVKPDIIFGPLGRVPLPNKIMVYLSKKFSIPIISYLWDDHYSLKKFSISFFFWIRTFVERGYIKECANHSEFMFTIIDEMKNEYERNFNKKCYVLNKSYDFISRPPSKEIIFPIKMLYMGNIGGGREKVLIELVKKIVKINDTEQKYYLDIYTSTPVSKKLREKLNIQGCSSLNKAVPQTQLLGIMSGANILVHVTPMDLKNRLLERLSFSTKVVDYLYSGKCILSIGGETATSKYLKKNDAAIVINNINEIDIKLMDIMNNKEIIKDFELKAWSCGKRNHNKQDTKDIIIKLFSDVKERKII